MRTLKIINIFRLKIVLCISLCVISILVFPGAKSTPEHDTEIPEISRQINEFTLNLLKHNAGIPNAPANTILSPQSIFHGLAMSYIASGGNTRNELAGICHFPDDNRKLNKDLVDLRRQLLSATKHKKTDLSDLELKNPSK